jgi:hypothetical protein
VRRRLRHPHGARRRRLVRAPLRTLLLARPPDGTDLPQAGGDFRYVPPDRGRAARDARAEPLPRGATAFRLRADSRRVRTRPRAASASKYTVRKMFGFGGTRDQLSSVPLPRASVLGIVISFLGLIYLAYVIRIRLLPSRCPGWTSVVAAVVVLGESSPLPRHHRPVPGTDVRRDQGPSAVPHRRRHEQTRRERPDDRVR